MNGGWGISYEIALRWTPLDLTDDKSTLVQVMAWCRQATSHYLSQFWPRSMSPNDVTRLHYSWPIWCCGGHNFFGMSVILPCEMKIGKSLPICNESTVIMCNLSSFIMFHCWGPPPQKVVTRINHMKGGGGGGWGVGIVAGGSRWNAYIYIFLYLSCELQYIGHCRSC